MSKEGQAYKNSLKKGVNIRDDIPFLTVFVWPLLILLIHYVPSVADILTPWSYKANVNYNKYF
jgi:hypothetical protein